MAESRAEADLRGAGAGGAGSTGFSPPSAEAAASVATSGSTAGAEGSVVVVVVGGSLDGGGSKASFPVFLTLGAGGANPGTGALAGGSAAGLDIRGTAGFACDMERGT
jgi:hypothetical protein